MIDTAIWWVGVLGILHFTTGFLLYGVILFLDKHTIFSHTIGHHLLAFVGSVLLGFFCVLVIAEHVVESEEPLKVHLQKSFKFWFSEFPKYFIMRIKEKWL